MQAHGIIIIIVVGILAGWIAGLITKGRGFGILTDMIIGIAGAFLGNYLFGVLGIAVYGFLGLLLAAVVGAVVLLVILGIVRKLA